MIYYKAGFKTYYAVGGSLEVIEIYNSDFFPEIRAGSTAKLDYDSMRECSEDEFNEAHQQVTKRINNILKGEPNNG